MADEQRRLIFVEMLPGDVSTYVMLHMAQYPTFDTLSKFVKDYVKVVAHQHALKSQKPLFLLDEPQQQRQQTAPLEEEREVEEDTFSGFNEADSAEILAFMRAKGIQKPGARRFPPRTGQQGQQGFRAERGQPPPRSKADMSCVNCGAKGHMGSECRKPKVEFGKRPCFICNKSGHLARNCPDKPASRPALKMVEDGFGGCAGECLHVCHSE